ncbi:hypothetical protein J4225_04540 [Candidatus Pacearchaeota archaeon]|nr:hypothetical protein [Candidatus Pacearchaeota archaeon]
MAWKKEKIDFKYNFKVYWEILKEHKSMFFALLFVTLTVEALLIVDKFLFKKIIDDGTEFIAGTIAQAVFVKTLFVLASVFIGISLIRTIGKWFNIHLLNVLDAQLIWELKRKYFNHILGLSHSFHTTHRTGSLISRLN